MCPGRSEFAWVAGHPRSSLNKMAEALPLLGQHKSCTHVIVTWRMVRMRQLACMMYLQNKLRKALRGALCLTCRRRKPGCIHAGPEDTKRSTLRLHGGLQRERREEMQLLLLQKLASLP